MVDRTVCVKIGTQDWRRPMYLLIYFSANISQSMLSNVASSGNEQQDCRALGLLMIRLMEQGARVGAGASSGAGNFFRYKWASSGHSDRVLDLLSQFACVMVRISFLRM